MPTIDTSQDAQLHDVEERLARKFAASASAEQVHESVQRAYNSFEGAHIRSYIPVLVAKMATGELHTAVRELART
jgi:hypothetical protein